MKIIRGDKVYIQMRSLLFLASYCNDDVFISMYLNSMLNGFANYDFILVNDDNISRIVTQSVFIFNYLDFMEYSVAELNVMLASLDNIYLEGKERLSLIHKKCDLEDMIRFRNEEIPYNFIDPDFNIYCDVFKLLKKDN